MESQISFGPKKRLHKFARMFLRDSKRVIINPRTEKRLLICSHKTPIPFTYGKPKLTPTTIVERAPEITPVGMDDLKRWKLAIVSVPVGHLRWFRGQHSRYVIVDEDNVRNYTLVEELPRKHKLQFDKINNYVRLVGRNASPTGLGKWTSVRRKE